MCDYILLFNLKVLRLRRWFECKHIGGISGVDCVYVWMIVWRATFFYFVRRGVHLNKLSKQKSINYCASVARKCETNRTTNRIGEKRASAVCSNEQFPCRMKWQIVIGRIQFSCGTNSFMLFIFCSLRYFFLSPFLSRTP